MLSSTFCHIDKQKILVVGDFLVDSYTFGKARRISPEAPVVIVNVMEQEYSPGGAGNVALNLISLGQSVTVVGRIGSGASMPINLRTAA